MRKTREVSSHPDTVFMAADFFSVSTVVKNHYYLFPYVSKDRHNTIIIKAIDLLFEAKKALDRDSMLLALDEAIHFLEYSDY